LRSWIGDCHSRRRANRSESSSHSAGAKTQQSGLRSPRSRAGSARERSSSSRVRSSTGATWSRTTVCRRWTCLTRRRAIKVQRQRFACFRWNSISDAMRQMHSKFAWKTAISWRKNRW
jgi:hypothetical protein